jgi:hypothetical protein
VALLVFAHRGSTGSTKVDVGIAIAPAIGKGKYRGWGLNGRYVRSRRSERVSDLGSLLPRSREARDTGNCRLAPRPPSHLTDDHFATAVITCAIPGEANQASAEWHC